MKTVQEGRATITISETEKISKELEVFYNPVMKLNRDLTILLFKAMSIKQWLVSDILAGTGIRTIRLLKEVDKKKISHILANDLDKEFIEKNLDLNGLADDPRVSVTHTEANKLMLAMRPVHYIDIDPFGSPNPFLNNAVQRMLPKGVLAVTATDTSALAGTYPKACRRKYWAEPMRNEFMHEIGIRILIRKVQLIGAQFEKALIPIVSYTNQHYYRIFFRVERGKTKVDEQLKQHKLFLHCPKCFTNQYAVAQQDCCNKRMLWAGPLFSGKLQDKKLLKKMASLTKEAEIEKLLNLLIDEDDVSVPGFFDLHRMNKTLKCPSLPKFEKIITAVKKKHKAARTHTNIYGLKTDMPTAEFIKLYKKIAQHK